MVEQSFGGNDTTKIVMSCLLDTSLVEVRLLAASTAHASRYSQAVGVADKFNFTNAVKFPDLFDPNKVSRAIQPRESDIR